MPLPALPEKFYRDGEEVTLYQLCRHEPAWAEHRIRHLAQELDRERVLYKSLSEMHEAAKKDWWAEREKLRSENARLRDLLDKALDDHLESRMGACDDDCWCWAAEKVLEDTK